MAAAGGSIDASVVPRLNQSQEAADALWNGDALKMANAAEKQQQQLIDQARLGSPPLLSRGGAAAEQQPTPSQQRFVSPFADASSGPLGNETETGTGGHFHHHGRAAGVGLVLGVLFLIIGAFIGYKPRKAEDTRSAEYKPDSPKVAAKKRALANEGQGAQTYPGLDETPARAEPPDSLIRTASNSTVQRGISAAELYKQDYIPPPQESQTKGGVCTPPRRTCSRQSQDDVLKEGTGGSGNSVSVQPQLTDKTRAITQEISRPSRNDDCADKTRAITQELSDGSPRSPRRR